MNWALFEGCKRERSLKGVGMQSMELIRIQWIGGYLRDAKGTFSEGCWAAVIGVVKNIKNVWLLSIRKREWSLKGVGTQSMELVKTQWIGACLRDSKGNGPWKVVKHRQWGCWQPKALVVVWGIQKGTVSQWCWNAVNWAVEDKELVVIWGQKRERSLKCVGTQSMGFLKKEAKDLVRTQWVVGFFHVGVTG
jgi:hypothetical protein